MEYLRRPVGWTKPISAETSSTVATQLFSSAALLAATTGSAIVMSAGLNVAGAPLRSAGWSVLPIVVATMMVLLATLRIRVPGPPYQVRAEWGHWGTPTLTLASWGLLLGAGLLTRIVSPIFYAFVLLIVTVPTVHQAVFAGIAYGGTRAIAMIAGSFKPRLVLRLRRSRTFELIAVASVAAALVEGLFM